MGTLICTCFGYCSVWIHRYTECTQLHRGTHGPGVTLEEGTHFSKAPTSPQERESQWETNPCGLSCHCPASTVSAKEQCCPIKIAWRSQWAIKMKNWAPCRRTEGIPQPGWCCHISSQHGEPKVPPSCSFTVSLGRIHRNPGICPSLITRIFHSLGTQ